MIFRFFLEILMKSKAKPRKIMKNDETPLNFRKNNKSQKKKSKNHKIIIKKSYIPRGLIKFPIFPKKNASPLKIYDFFMIFLWLFYDFSIFLGNFDEK